MRINSTRSIVLLGMTLLLLNGCSSANSNLTPAPATRGATQTPWIIYQPVTVTPEPATITPLPTVGAPPAEGKTPTRTPTKAAVVAAKTATKAAPTVAIAAVPTATSAPACNLGTVTPKEPEPNASRNTKEVGVGGDTFRFIWDPPASMQSGGDPSLGYQLIVKSKTNGATIYLSNNKYWNDGKIYIMDKPAVSALAGGAATIVTWNVTTIKVTNGSFNDSDPSIRPAGFVTCGTPTDNQVINLAVY